VHGDKYDYSQINYINSSTKVKIICKEHGNFTKFPNNHLAGSGCKKCTIHKKFTNDEIISKFVTIHGDKYNYSLVKYVDAHIKVKIICKEHGVFEQLVHNHLRNETPCYKCAVNNRKINLSMNKSDVIKRFMEVHNDLYDYSLVDYRNMRTDVKIICKEHGVFEQTPANHSQGRGCRYCKQIYRYNDRETFLYYIKVEEQYKIGICLRGNYKSVEAAINNRYYSELKNGIIIEILEYDLFINGKEAYILEQHIVKYNRKLQILKENMILKTGYTETFTKDIRNLDDI